MYLHAIINTDADPILLPWVQLRCYLVLCMCALPGLFVHALGSMEIRHRHFSFMCVCVC